MNCLGWKSTNRALNDLISGGKREKIKRKRKGNPKGNRKVKGKEIDNSLF